MPDSPRAGEASQAASLGERSIAIGRDAHGNVLIAGEHNTVVLTVVAAREVGAGIPGSALGEPSRGDAGSNPYRGLAAFHEDDAELFFGRAAAVRELRERFSSLHAVVVDIAPTRLLAVLGPSGSGKSSLVRAGLVPALVRDPIPSMRRARICVLAPGAHPLDALGMSLARVATADPAPVAKAREFADELRTQAADGAWNGLRRIAGALPDIGSSPLILLVDQFEETFALCDDAAERAAFIGTVLDAAVDRSRYVSVILTLRTDFYAETYRHPELARVLSAHGYLVPALSTAELREIIAEPARRAGRPLDSAVVELLLSQVEGQDASLPLIEIALSRVWEAMMEGESPECSLRALGGVGGAIASEAERLYQALPTDEDRAIARRAFLALVQLGEGVRDTGRQATVSEMTAQNETPEHVLEVLRTFASASARLLTLSAALDSESAAQVQVQITHDALLEHWDRLRSWVDEGRADTRAYRRLADVGARWEAAGRPSGLLWRSPDLELLRGLVARRGSDFTSAQRAFTAASEQLQRSERTRRRALRTAAGIAAAVLAIMAGVAVYAGQMARGRLGLLYEEQGRQALLGGDFQRAAAYLSEAYGIDSRRPSLRYLVAQAMRGLEAQTLSLRSVEAFGVDPGGTRLVTVRGDGVVQSFDLANGRSLSVVRLTDDSSRHLRCAAIAPTTGHVVAVERGDSVLVWDPSAATPVSRFAAPGGASCPLHIPYDGQSVLLVNDSTATWWHTASGQARATLAGAMLRRFETISPDGRYIVVLPERPSGWESMEEAIAKQLELPSKRPDTVVVLDATTGSPARVFGHPRNDVHFKAFSPDSRHALLEERIPLPLLDRRLVIVDLLSGHRVRALDSDSTSDSASASYACGGRCVLGRIGTTARVWNARSGRLLRTVDHPARVTAADISPEADLLVTGDSEGSVRLWSLTTGPLLARFDDPTDEGGAVTPSVPHAAGSLDGPSSRVALVRFSRAGTRILTGNAAGRLRVWNIESLTGGVRLGAPPFGVTGATRVTAAFSPDGERLITTVWSDVRVDTTDGLTRALLGTLQAVDSTMRQFREMTGEADRGWQPTPTVQVLSASTGAPIYRLPDRHGYLQADFSSSGRSIVTLGADSVARVWNAATGAPQGTLGDSLRPVLQMVVAPSAELVLLRRDSVLEIWDAARRAKTVVLPVDAYWVACLAWTRDGNRIVGQDHYNVLVWDARSGALVGKLDKDADRLKRGEGPCAQAADRRGHLVASAAWPNSVAVWGTSWRSRNRFADEPRWTMRDVHSWVADAERRRMVVVRRDGAVHVLDAASGNVLGSLDLSLRSTATDDRRGRALWMQYLDASRLLTNTGEWRTTIWDASSFQVLAVLPAAGSGSERATMPMVVSPDAQKMVSIGTDYRLHVWDVGHETRSPAEVAAAVRCRGPFRLADGRLTRNHPVPDDCEPTKPR